MDGVIQEAEAELAKVKTKQATVELRAKYLGKKSQLQGEFKLLGSMGDTERKDAGQRLNQLKLALESLFDTHEKSILSALDSTLPPLDLTKPGLGAPYGHLHPITIVLDELYNAFTRLGFAIVDSPEIETDWYNFEALNMPPDHPARDMQDTFYIKDEGETNSILPRTHTSGMQVRFMEDNKPPFKIIVPGKVFRNEDEDRTHSWSFTQIEGLVVGEGVSVADLKGTLLTVMKDIMGEDTQIRLRPSFFPYTEPSIEIDVSYRGEWLEILGAGMVHPRVLSSAHVDPEVYSGFAFGVGAERIAMVKFGISDIRHFWRPNLAYLEQF